MKKYLSFVTVLALNLFVSIRLPASVRIIEFKTVKKGDLVHWSPDKVEVTAGEKIKFLVKHELEGGFDFHGFSIPELGIAEQINRNVPKEIPAEVPKTLAAGEYNIGCQFHPKHVAAKLDVKAQTKESKKTPR